jgi:hypothetical protein
MQVYVLTDVWSWWVLAVLQSYFASFVSLASQGMQRPDPQVLARSSERETRKAKGRSVDGWKRFLCRLLSAALRMHALTRTH